MTKFAPIDLCKKLVELGCKSESGFYRFCHFPTLNTYSEPIWYSDGMKGLSPAEYLPAFEQNDLTGSHKQAMENARLVWGEDVEDSPGYYSFAGANVHRHEMIDSEDWVKYLQDSLAEAAL